MTRIILQYLLPLILPTAVYLGWMWAVRHRSKARGDEMPEIRNVALFWSLAAGVVLMIGVLVFFAVTGGAPPGEGTYQSPRFEDGEIVPPKFQ